MLILKSKLMGLYKANDFTDKETGELKVGKTKLQLQTTRTMKDGSQKIELIDLSIPAEKVDQYKNKVGQMVDVQVATVGKTTFYGI